MPPLTPIVDGGLCVALCRPRPRTKHKRDPMRDAYSCQMFLGYNTETLTVALFGTLSALMGLYGF